MDVTPYSPVYRKAAVFIWGGTQNGVVFSYILGGFAKFRNFRNFPLGGF
jgi:hypothetical protein